MNHPHNAPYSWTPEEEKEALELKELFVDRVDVVRRPACGKRFTILKSTEDTVTCKSCGAAHNAAAVARAAASLPKRLTVACLCGELLKIDDRAQAEGAIEEAISEAKRLDAEGRKTEAADLLDEAEEAMKELA